MRVMVTVMVRVMVMVCEETRHDRFHLEFGHTHSHTHTYTYVIAPTHALTPLHSPRGGHQVPTDSRACTHGTWLATSAVTRIHHLHHHLHHHPPPPRTHHTLTPLHPSILTPPPPSPFRHRHPLAQGLGACVAELPRLRPTRGGDAGHREIFGLYGAG